MNDLRFLFENLFINKYDLKYIRRPARAVMQVVAAKKDEFGFDIEYQFFFLTELISANAVARYRQSKDRNILIIGQEGQADADLTGAGFYDKLDTLIDPGIYLNPNLEQMLNLLGHNQLPSGMSGKPDDLLEDYVKECLQFMLGGKGRRYGKERAFESLPDGAVLGKGLTILFDAKAYSGGFNPSADDLKRFKSYIEAFNHKYEHFNSKVYSFLVISGRFDVGEQALADRSQELYEMCQTTLTFMSAGELARMIAALLAETGIHPSVNWKKLFAKPVPKLKDLNDHIVLIKKDKIS